MARVFCGALSTETNVFSPVPTDLDSFRSHLFEPAGALPTDGSRPWPAPLEAFRRFCAANHHELVQGLCTAAPPGGTTPSRVYEHLRDTLLADLGAALPVDMVALKLHGAMIAVGCDDCEGDILRRVRALVGPAVPVGAVLDPHAHLTTEMTRHANLLVFFKEYPHTDVFESARALIELLERCRQGLIRPKPAVFDCRMISFYFTDREPMRGFVRRLRDLESEPGILSASLVHGFPWGDTPDMGTKVLLYTDGDSGEGPTRARQLGIALFAERGRTMPELQTIDAALAAVEAQGAAAKPIVLADVADNPGGGAPGDSTFLVRALLDRGIERVVVGPFWDPLAVRAAYALGEGARGVLRIGGKASPFSGAPLDLEVTIGRLAPDARQTVEGWAWPMGDTALLRTRNLSLVVTTERLQCINTDVFRAVGIDVTAERVAVVKSAQHFLAAFAPLAAQVLYVTSPGTLSVGSDASRYRHLQRPKWPFDPDPFSPREQRPAPDRSMNENSLGRN